MNTFQIKRHEYTFTVKDQFKNICPNYENISLDEMHEKYNLVNFLVWVKKPGSRKIYNFKDGKLLKELKNKDKKERTFLKNNQFLIKEKENADGKISYFLYEKRKDFEGNSYWEIKVRNESPTHHTKEFMKAIKSILIEKKGARKS